MKKILKIVVLSGIIALAMTLSIFTSNSQSVAVVESPKDQLSFQQRAWLGALEWCEGRGNPKAINPKDRDNTPSYGLLQFKPATMAMFEKEYNVTGPLMDASAQEQVVVEMILSGRKDWSHQFPDCTKKLGNPPHLST